MLVVISDIHLTDNGFSGTIPATAFRIFRERLRDMAYDASWRADGTYRPIEELDLVLLGDILDVIRSERWPCVPENHPDYLRPWSDPQSEAFQAKLGEITNAILERNEESLAVLRSLAEVITLPPATAGGRAARVSREPDARERVPVRVRIHYVVGNHDWFFHLPGEAFNLIRRCIVERMALANTAGEPFPHEPGDSAALAALCEAHRVYLRHGDIFDAFNFHGQRNRSSIGDAIVIDLLNRFCLTVERELGSELPKECLAGLRQIDHVRPLLIVPVWVDGLLRRACVEEKLAGEVKRIWDRLAEEFLEMDFVRRCAEYLPPLTLDKLGIALKFAKGVSLHRIAQLFSWFNENLPGRNGRPSFEDAFGEDAFQSRRADGIIYGHTHHHEIVPLEANYSNGRPLHRIYANTGTWRVVNEQTRLEPENQEFMSYWVMTYAGFFKADERGGRPFEAWSGTLALHAR